MVKHKKLHSNSLLKYDKNLNYIRITGLASFCPRELTLPSLTREVRTTEDASPKFAYLVLRNTHRPNVKSPNYLPNLLGSLDCDGNVDSNRSWGKKFLGHIVPGHFGGKAAQN